MNHNISTAQSPQAKRIQFFPKTYAWIRLETFGQSKTNLSIPTIYILLSFLSHTNIWVNLTCGYYQKMEMHTLVMITNKNHSLQYN